MNKIDLSGVRILITGASSGLGLAMAQALLKAKASVALVARDEQKLNNKVQLFKANGLDAHSLVFDVRDEKSIEDGIEWVKNNWGTLDVLINNAGIGMQSVNPKFMIEPKPFFEVSPEGFRNLIDINLTGYFLVSRSFVPLMIAARGGKVINISMNHSTMSRKGFIPYGPSRAATESLSTIMAQDLLDLGVTVNMLLPGGATDTGMIPQEMKPLIQTPLLSPDIMSDPIIYLASEESDGVTGKRIVATEFSQWIKASSK